MKINLSKKRLFFVPALILLALYLFLVFALTLPLNRVLANTVLSDTWLPNGLLTVIDLSELAAYALIASWAMYAAYLPCPPSVGLRIGLLASVTTVLRYALTVMSAGILYGFRVFWQWYFEPTLLNNIPYCLFDLLFIVFAIVLAQAGSARSYRKQAKKGTFAESPRAFSKLFDKRNPIQVSLLLCGVFLAVFKILADLIFDIRYLPQISSIDVWDIFSLIGSYASDLLFGILFYILSVLIVSRLNKPKQSSALPEESELQE